MKNIIIAVVVIVLLALGYWFWQNEQAKQSAQVAEDKALLEAGVNGEVRGDTSEWEATGKDGGADVPN